MLQELASVMLTQREISALLDLLRVLPEHIELDERQAQIAERLRRKLREVRI